jgi:hypothetical protein
MLLAGLLLASPALADAAKIIARADKADSIVVPADSTLRFRAFDTEGTAKFDGAIELSGTYYYGDTQLDDGTTETTLYLMPDAATKARLPHFKTRGLPDSIFLSNGAAFAKAVIAKGSIKKGKVVSGKIDIMADRFEAGIECDAPFFNARFLSVAHPPLRVANTDMPDVGC